MNSHNGDYFLKKAMRICVMVTKLWTFISSIRISRSLISWCRPWRQHFL